MAVLREVLPDGAVQIGADGCTFHYQRPRPGILLVTIRGDDRGQFGTATLDEIALGIQREGPIELFVDARAALGAAISVSKDWTRFFTTNRSSLVRVHVIVGSQAVRLTVAIARHLSRTDNLIQIYSDPAIFESRLFIARP
jgi:hypothetical protein